MQVTWVFPGIPPVPQTNVPPTFKTDTHEGPRREKTGQDMMYQFFKTGEIIVSQRSRSLLTIVAEQNTCKGPCQGRPLSDTRQVREAWPVAN